MTNEDAPDKTEASGSPAPEGESARAKPAGKETGGRKRLAFGHGLIEPRPPGRETAGGETSLPVREGAVPKPEQKVKKDKAGSAARRRDLPFGVGIVEVPSAAKADAAEDTTLPETAAAAGGGDERAAARPAAFDILPFSDAPLPERRVIPGPEALPELDGYGEDVAEERAGGEGTATEDEPVAAAESAAESAAEAPAEREAVRRGAGERGRESAVEEPEGEADAYEEGVPDYFDEIVEYEIIDPPDDDEDDGFDLIPAGPMQEVRFEERIPRRSRERAGGDGEAV